MWIGLYGFIRQQAPQQEGLKVIIQTSLSFLDIVYIISNQGWLSDIETKELRTHKDRQKRFSFKNIRSSVHNIRQLISHLQ